MLRADPICHWPLCHGTQRLVCRAPATVADHIKPRAKFPELAYDVDNGQGLCATHHRHKNEEERRGVYRDTR